MPAETLSHNGISVEVSLPTRPLREKVGNKSISQLIFERIVDGIPIEPMDFARRLKRHSPSISAGSIEERIGEIGRAMAGSRNKKAVVAWRIFSEKKGQGLARLLRRENPSAMAKRNATPAKRPLQHRPRQRRPGR